MFILHLVTSEADSDVSSIGLAKYLPPAPEPSYAAYSGSAYSGSTYNVAPTCAFNFTQT